jgi:hypothetical protein
MTPKPISASIPLRRPDFPISISLPLLDLTIRTLEQPDDFPLANRRDLALIWRDIRHNAIQYITATARLRALYPDTPRDLPLPPDDLIA